MTITVGLTDNVILSKDGKKLIEDHVDLWEKSAPDTGNSRCIGSEKGP